MSAASNPRSEEPAPENGATRAKVALSGVTETLLIPLLGRAIDASQEDSILRDLYAKAAIEKLDYDFAKLPLPLTQAKAVTLRTRLYDSWAASFLDRNPRATVLHLACGLDSRNQRLAWAGPDVRWIDIDLPEVVALRRQVLPTSLPDGRDYRLLAADVTDVTWLQEIPTDRPVLVIMEGLVSYLKEEQGRRLFEHLATRFEEGELHFECMSASTMDAANKRQDVAVSKTGAKFQWANDDPKDVEAIHPRLKLLEATKYVELAYQTPELSWAVRASFWGMSWVPSIREGIRFVRFQLLPRESYES